ncbi:DUF2270 domain-containing protein [Haloarchaeobius amylolyticus]|uniref:DUF2270 domain-containing protein n=1 Tax=Haloarchaeobius amylolyticus TaxID=1198296 RepID=UPI00226FD8B3|nr:DUF2270 domain-containing protein [Haloarchaeobius amylolyticus]
MTADDEPFDPSSEEARDIGAGLLEADMGPSSSLAHLYRGEIHRMKFWRERLDRTTNWAVTTLAAILTFAFASPDHPHYLILIAGVMLSTFLVMEARRYRGYDMWRSRVRVLQENVFAKGLDPSVPVADPEWRRKLARDYRTPVIKISFEEALAHRLRRVYLPLFTILGVAWLARVFVVPTERPWPETAAVGRLSGEVVTVMVGLAYVTLVVIALRPRTWKAKGELREEDVAVWDD